VANHSSWDNKLLVHIPISYTKDKTGKIISPMPDWSDVADFNYDNPPCGRTCWRRSSTGARVRDRRLPDGHSAAIVPLDFWRQVRTELVKLNRM
jgi:hypothetical protein